ncbi:MAG: sigma-70 family RNA polymerase sigma factor [Oscillospiraceae bacterium]|nr:sigma-70 family RNA polymerase sigma factor [Oscillospiraceae bacterium]
MEDAQIISLYFARDERALTETSQKYGGLCCSTGQRILGNSQDTEECWNDVLLKAWNRIPPERPQYFAAYLVTMMRNAALTLYEKLHAEKRGGTQTMLVLDELENCLSAPDDVEETVSAAETGEQIRQFVKTLSEDARNIFILRYVYMMPVKEIAERFHIGQSKVKVSLHRSRAALRDYLGGDRL